MGNLQESSPQRRSSVPQSIEGTPGGGRAGRGCVGTCLTFTSACIAPFKHQKLQLAGGSHCLNPLSLTVALEKPARRDQKQKHSGCGWLSPLSRREVCAQACQAWLPIREARPRPRGSTQPAPSQHPPDPLPTNQCLIDAGWGAR